MVEHGEPIPAIRLRNEDYMDRRIILHDPADTSGEMIIYARICLHTQWLIPRVTTWLWLCDASRERDERVQIDRNNPSIYADYAVTCPQSAYTSTGIKYADGFDAPANKYR